MHSTLICRSVERNGDINAVGELGEMHNSSTVGLKLPKCTDKDQVESIFFLRTAKMGTLKIRTLSVSAGLDWSHRRMRRGVPSAGNTPTMSHLHIACDRGIQELALSLVRLGADVNSEIHGWPVSPLAYAAAGIGSRTHALTINSLLSHGLDLTIKSWSFTLHGVFCMSMMPDDVFWASPPLWQSDPSLHLGTLRSLLDYGEKLRATDADWQELLILIILSFSYV